MVVSEKRFNSLLRDVVEIMIRREYDWPPPGCGGILYQPKRPAKVPPKARKESNT